MPPPHPEGYVNEFILPLFEGGSTPADWGLEYNAADPGSSTWTLPIGIEDVDAETSTFKVPEDMVGDWGGNIPPEASGPVDGYYTIQSWPMSDLMDNGDGTVTFTVAIGAMPSGAMPV